jgi:hypothetical protein
METSYVYADSTEVTKICDIYKIPEHIFVNALHGHPVHVMYFPRLVEFCQFHTSTPDAGRNNTFILID